MFRPSDYMNKKGQAIQDGRTPFDEDEILQLIEYAVSLDHFQNIILYNDVMEYFIENYDSYSYLVTAKNMGQIYNAAMEYGNLRFIITLTETIEELVKNSSLSELSSVKRSGIFSELFKDFIFKYKPFYSYYFNFEDEDFIKRSVLGSPEFANLCRINYSDIEYFNIFQIDKILDMCLDFRNIYPEVSTSSRFIEDTSIVLSLDKSRIMKNIINKLNNHEIDDSGLDESSFNYIFNQYIIKVTENNFSPSIVYLFFHGFIDIYYTESQ